MNFGDFMRWIFRSSEMPPHARAALQLADEVAESANIVSQQLAGYLNHKDPFIALAADVYERQQERNIWKGMR